MLSALTRGFSWKHCSARAEGATEDHEMATFNMDVVWMSVLAERAVAAAPIVVVDPDKVVLSPAAVGAKSARKAREADRAEDIARWKTLTDAGGRAKWV